MNLKFHLTLISQGMERLTNAKTLLIEYFWNNEQNTHIAVAFTVNVYLELMSQHYETQFPLAQGFSELHVVHEVFLRYELGQRCYIRSEGLQANSWVLVSHIFKWYPNSFSPVWL